ncbi:MAG: hypothetical protein OXG17_08710 [Chloroflexi bacterium]|nr:hypothetical protein [Chloroflexota bacterium]
MNQRPIAPGEAPVPQYLTRPLADAPAAAQPFGRRSWLAWIAATTIGWAVAEVLYRTLVEEIPFTSLLRGGIGVGVFMAVFQALVLRRHLGRPVRWILASGVVAVLASPVEASALANVYTAYGPGAAFAASMALTSLAVGLLAGTLQWLVLRRHVKRAAWWIPASALAMVAGMPLAGFAAMLALAILDVFSGIDIDPSVLGLAHGLAAAITYAAITGYTLLRLFRSPLS